MPGAVIGAMSPLPQASLMVLLAPSAAPPPITPHRLLNEALFTLHHVFSGGHIEYAVHGSCAALLHGALVQPPPGDIDVVISERQLMGAIKELSVHCRLIPSARPTGVHNFRHTNGTIIQLIGADDFGMPIRSRDTVSGVSVLNVEETLFGLLIRPPRLEGGDKDQVAFATLADGRGHHLSPTAQDRIVVEFMHRRGITRRVSWQEMIEIMRKGGGAPGSAE
jgi:hypothetical protein